MSVAEIIDGLALSEGSYVQPEGIGPWYDHTGKIADSQFIQALFTTDDSVTVEEHANIEGLPSIVTPTPSACVFVWKKHPGNILAPYGWDKVSGGCSIGNCLPPLENRSTTPVGTMIIVPCH
jgi:hypothetical protein